MYFIYYPQSYHLIQMQGPDSTDFLQRLTTAHVKALQPGEGAPACFLNAQGRIRSYFQLWKCAASEYLFEIDGGLKDEWVNHFRAAIEQYTFAEKFTLNDFSNSLQCLWFFSDEQSLRANWPRKQKISLEQNSIKLCCQGSINQKFHFSLWGKAEDLKTWLETELGQTQLLSESELEAWRIQDLLPRVDFEIKDSVTPLELGLKNAIAHDKGCYPGQEAIERTLALGSPAKRLGLIEFETALSQEDRLALQNTKLYQFENPSIEVGELSSTSSEKNKTLALALIKKIYIKEGLEVLMNLDQKKIKGHLLRLAAYE